MTEPYANGGGPSPKVPGPRFPYGRPWLSAAVGSIFGRTLSL
jgi:hypothetical protein